MPRSLLTFESFLPKNVDQRADKLQKMAAQQLQDFLKFVEQLQSNIAAVQGLQVADGTAQTFINLLQSLDCRIDQEMYPFCIYIYNAQDTFFFEYHWLDGDLYCQYHQVWAPLGSHLNYDYVSIQRYMQQQWQKYLQVKPTTVKAVQYT